MTDKTDSKERGSIISSSDILLHDAETALMYEELRAAIDDGHESMTHADALAEIAAIRAENVELRAQLESIGAGGVSGPLMGRADSKEREALIRAITSMCHDMDNDKIIITRREGEGPALRQLLDAMQRELASLAASAGSEPVARVNDDGFIVEIGDLPIAPGQKLYLHPSPPEGMVGGWQDIATAPEGQMVVVGWLDPEDTEHPERHDFDLLEDGCWQQWHEHAEHVEIIGGHGVSYTPPYTVWMPVSPIPTSSADSRKGE